MLPFTEAHGDLGWNVTAAQQQEKGQKALGIGR